jgi:hypothetical protein
MAQEATTVSERLLLNAEAFGFGPTAAIAECFPHLRSNFKSIGYVGTGHTLDLQKPLAYDKIHDLAIEQDVEQIFAGYDIFVTAMDFQMAARALASGLKVIIYDALTWYWKEIPAAAKDCHLYLSQDFWGVRAKLGRLSNFAVVPPLIPFLAPPRLAQDATAPTKSKDLVLLNLGGLSNPFWSRSQVHAYAELVLDCFAASGVASKMVVIAGNSDIAATFQHHGVRTTSKQDLLAVLEQAGLAFMTPGLGNIYDAARFDLPTIWLPPANDSQGQQLKLLEAAGCSDGSLDWPSFMGGDVDYFAEQTVVLQKLSSFAAESLASSELKTSLAKRMLALSRQVPTRSATVALIDQFGSGGAKVVADHIVSLARSKSDAGCNSKSH